MTLREMRLENKILKKYYVFKELLMAIKWFWKLTFREDPHEYMGEK